jgi:hypothetical protein
MANKVDTVEKDGRLVHVYDNGLELDAESGHIVKPAPGTLLTPERARAARRKRQEKTARLTRRALVDVHNSIMPHPVKTSAEAFAAALAMIHEQVTLNSEAYPRDRLEALEKIGKWSELIPSDKKQAEEDSAAAGLLHGAAAGAGAEFARFVLKVLSDVQKVQSGESVVIEGKTVE